MVIIELAMEKVILDFLEEIHNRKREEFFERNRRAMGLTLRPDPAPPSDPAPSSDLAPFHPAPPFHSPPA